MTNQATLKCPLPAERDQLRELLAAAVTLVSKVVNSDSDDTPITLLELISDKKITAAQIIPLLAIAAAWVDGHPGAHPRLERVVALGRAHFHGDYPFDRPEWGERACFASLFAETRPAGEARGDRLRGASGRGTEIGGRALRLFRSDVSGFQAQCHCSCNRV